MSIFSDFIEYFESIFIWVINWFYSESDVRNDVMPSDIGSRG